jgi:hypothetical protein
MAATDASVTAIATKDTGQPGTYSKLTLDDIIVKCQSFQSLSDLEKQDMVTYATSLAERGFQLEKIVKSLTNLRSGEGAIAKKMLERFITSITPIELKREGVYHPLMSGYPSGKDFLEIFIPDDLAPYADHGIILELFRYMSSVPAVKFTRVTGELKIQNEERLTQLIMGYISELLSDQKIAKISFTRSSYYQLGRMLARAKLLEFVTADLKIPMKYVQVPSRFLGGTTSFQEPESIRTLKSLISGDIDLINDLLKNLAAHVYKTQGCQVRQKIDDSLFTAFPEFVHMFERRARVESKKGRGRKIQSSFTTIKATKPSTLTTVAPWEREAAQELYDTPWAELANLEREFNQTSAIDRNYNDLAKRLATIISEQWIAKQTLLRKTNHRLVLSGLDDQTPLWQRLNKVRGILAEQKSLETCDRETLRRVIVAYDILPAGLVTLEDGFRNSWITAFKDGKLTAKYPATSRLIERYQANVTSDSPAVTAG